MPIIGRPDFTGDAIAKLLTDESEEAALKHNREKAARKKRQKTTAIAASAIVGGAAGAAFAGPAAASSTVMGAGLTTSGMSTLAAGQIAGGLSGSLLGAKVGGFIANEDYAGAIQTGIGGVQGLIQNQANEQFFGGKVTKEGMAAAGRLAEEAGTTIDALRAGGGTFQEGLAKARNSAAVRNADARTLNALAGQRAVTIGNSERAHAEDARNKATEASGQERSADPKIVSAIDEDLEKIDADAALYDRSKGSDGASYDELLKRSDITGRYNRAVASPPSKRKKPPHRILRADGTVREIPFGSGYIEGGKQFFPKYDKDGNFIGHASAEHKDKRIPPSQRAPEGSTPEQINEFIDAENDMAKRNAGIAEDRWDEFWVNPETGVPEQMRPDKGGDGDSDADFKERISEIRQQLAFKKKDNSLSEPTDKQIQFVLDQEEDFLERRKKKLKRIEGEKEGNEREEVQRGFLNDLGRVYSSKSLEEYAKIVNKIKDEYGDNMQFVPEAIVTQLESLAKVLKGNRPVEVPPELEGPLGGGAG